MYINKYSWSSAGTVLTVVGISMAALFIFLMQNSEFSYGFIILIAVCLIMAASGIAILRWDYKNTHKDMLYKIDRKADYTFILKTEESSETVTDFKQIEEAVKKYVEQKTGSVKVEISPEIGNIKYIECEYSPGNKYFYTYVFQKRKDGEGYWVSGCETTKVMLKSLKRLYKKHRMIDFAYYNRRETGAGR